VALARNGREALEQLSPEVPGAVLLDLMMPVMDGWQFAAELKARGLETRFSSSAPTMPSSGTRARCGRRPGWGSRSTSTSCSPRCGALVGPLDRFRGPPRRQATPHA